MKIFLKILIIPIIGITLLWCIGIYYVVQHQSAIKKQFSGKTNAHAVNKMLPNFTGTTLQGNQQISSDSFFKGPDSKYMILNVWASWCEPCKQELPLLNSISKSNSNVTVLGVNIRDSRESALNLVNSLHIEYLNLDDASGKISSALSSIVQFYAVPITLFVNKDGKVQVVFYESLLNLKNPQGILQKYLDNKFN
jgi:thiol-disulfide isomerase/thioredoxin